MQFFRSAPTSKMLPIAYLTVGFWGILTPPAIALGRKAGFIFRCFLRHFEDKNKTWRGDRAQFYPLQVSFNLT